jgi:hypothetical protein
MLRATILAVGLLGAAGVAVAATEDDFVVADTSDLIALCTAPVDSEHHVAALNFCHGYAVGAFQYYQMLEPVGPGHRFVCVAEPKPTRDEVISAFIVWAQAHPQFGGEPAVESLLRYLSETYPCPK